MIRVLCIFFLYISSANAIEYHDYFEGYVNLDIKEQNGFSMEEYININEAKCIRTNESKNYSSFFVETSKTKEVFISDSKIYDANLLNLSVNNNVLIFKFGALQKYRKFEVPVLVQVRKENREASPIAGVLAGIFTLGLYPILSPKEFAQRSLGCSDIESASFVYDTANKKSTDVTQSRPTNSFSSEVEIIGFQKDPSEPIKILEQFYGEGAEVDLRNLILENDVKNLNEITVRCLSCTNPSAEHKIDYNFQAAKLVLLKQIRDEEKVQEAAERSRLKQISDDEKAQKKAELEYKRKSKEIADKYEKDKQIELQDVKSQREKERNEKISKVKQKCEELGFVKATDKFSRCVLQLLE